MVMARKKTARKSVSKNGEQIQVVRANVERREVDSPTFASLYTNDTQLQLSPWDVRLIFGVISTPRTAAKPTVEITRVGEVRMSPQHAKKVTEILLSQLVGYEKQFGPIPQPKD